MLLVLGYVLDHATSIFAALAALAAFYKSLRNGAQITNIEIKVDGRLSQLIEALEETQKVKVKAALAEGTLAGVAEGTATGIAQERQSQVDRDSAPTNNHDPKS